MFYDVNVIVYGVNDLYASCTESTFRRVFDATLLEGYGYGIYLHNIMVPDTLGLVRGLPTPFARTFKRTVSCRVGCDPTPVKASTTQLGHILMDWEGSGGLEGYAPPIGVMVALAKTAGIRSQNLYSPMLGPRIKVVLVERALDRARCSCHVLCICG